MSKYRWYFLDENDIRHELNEDQARKANRGEIRHPITNELLDYVEGAKRVFMYFVASDLVKNIGNDSDGQA